VMTPAFFPSSNCLTVRMSDLPEQRLR
jgi:hypothetical protein